MLEILASQLPEDGLCLWPQDAGGKHPNDLITIGMIGTGSQGVERNLRHYLKYPELCRVVAVCVVSMLRATSAKNLVNNTYKSKDCKAYQDFREILEDKSIDADKSHTYRGAGSVELPAPGLGF